MVTSNKMPEKKVVKMDDQSNAVVVPQRTLLGEVNEHITCPLCRGYYIDATTIVECLHSFCRSCIIKHLQVKSYCPECEMMINSARPNIKPDKALQDIVYKLVPGLFQKEMERRQQFYSSRPGPAASATPEQRGEDTERIIFSPEDVISFSLEYTDATDTDSISSKSSDSNEPQPASATTRRYLQCPAVVNISHLKKFISMKFDIDSSQFSIDVLYKRVPLPDYYTLMDIAYIYNWKRNEPMRFFYQITDYIAIRTRYGLFDINRKGSHFRDRKSSPTPTEDTNASSPAPNFNEQGSEASSGTDSPMPDEKHIKKSHNNTKQQEKFEQESKEVMEEKLSTKSTSVPKKCDDEVEKSQFLNSFELTAKSTSIMKPVTVKLSKESVQIPTDGGPSGTKAQNTSPKVDEISKRKQLTPPTSPEVKKLKMEIDRTKLQSINQDKNSLTKTGTVPIVQHLTPKTESPGKVKEIMNKLPPASGPSSVNSSISPFHPKEMKLQQTVSRQQAHETGPLKRPIPGSQGVMSPKRKNNDAQQLSSSKLVSPLKLQLPKSEPKANSSISGDIIKPPPKKIPDLKPSVPPFQGAQNKGPGKVRMDLLANNSDPTIDRSKILSQVKTSLGGQNPGQSSGDPLKSLFDSCKINIPSSLSITLTEQKLEQRNQNDPNPTEPKKTVVNKNLSVGANNGGAHKVPSPPVHNYIQILKIPEAEAKKQVKGEMPQGKTSVSSESDSNPTQSKTPNKPLESTAKGPMPSLKPIADTKIGKQSGNFSSPITFQQTFEKQIQSIQSDKPKAPKNKLQVPKLMPATPKALSAANKLNSKPATLSNPLENKQNRSDNALDLSTPHNLHSQLGPQQSKAFETMQSIANLAKKQHLPTKTLPPNVAQNNIYTSIANRTMATASSIVTSNAAINNNVQTKPEKVNSPNSSQANIARHDTLKTGSSKTGNNSIASIASSSYQAGSLNSTNPAIPSPRCQTRSPSTSPKLVIAEEKHTSSMPEQNINQSNQITSTQLTNVNALKIEPPKSSPGPSKQVMKSLKPFIPANKITAIRPPINSNVKPNSTISNPTDYQLIAQHAMWNMELQNAWYNMRQLMNKNSHQSQNEMNKKEKQ